jgi:hypothetical protein
MDLTRDEARSAGLAANMAGRFDEAYRLLLPLAEAGDAEIQGIVGGLVIPGLHRTEGWDGIDEATARADLEQAGHFLRAASDAGIGPASFNWRPCSPWGTAAGRGRSVGHARPSCTPSPTSKGSRRSGG